MKLITSCTLKIRGGAERDCYGKRAGKGALIQWEKSGTLGVSQDQTLIVFYGTEKQTEQSGGGVAFSIIGDHDDRPTDMTNLIVYEESVRPKQTARLRTVERGLRNP